jgi:hypothetical protein
MPTPIPFAACGAQAGEVAHCTHTTFRYCLAVPACRTRATALAGIHRNGALAEKPNCRRHSRRRLVGTLPERCGKFRSEWRSLSEAWGLADLLYKLSWRPFQWLGFVSKPEGRHPVRLPHPRDFRKRTG